MEGLRPRKLKKAASRLKQAEERKNQVDPNVATICEIAENKIKKLSLLNLKEGACYTLLCLGVIPAVVGVGYT